MKKILIFSVIIISIISTIYVIQESFENNDILESNTIQEKDVVNNVNKIVEDELFFVEESQEDFLGKNELGIDRFSRFLLSPKNDNFELYRELGARNTKQTTVVVIPIFTMLAYSNPGFYQYYKGVCDESCLTVNAITAYQTAKFDYNSSAMANQVFQILGYERISDADVDKDPSILSKYDRVILLHNEYVTKEMFEAITNHPKVIYLYPNALYAEITTDHETSSITLIRGHGYPEKDISNGFDWEFENTNPYEFDNECKNWEFYEIDNGYMLNCYPEQIIFKDKRLLETIRDL